MKKYNDGAQEPTDFPTYAYHHLSLKEKTNSLEEDVRIVFSDLSTEQLATSFLLTTSPE
jgi:hypothetical protein